MTTKNVIYAREDISCILPESMDTEFDFYDAEQAPVSLYGVFREGDGFVRMPRHIARRVSERVAVRNEHTAGGRIRFVTDSSRIAVIAAVAPGGGMPHFAYTGVSGFDLYASGEGTMRYWGTIVPPPDHTGSIHGVVDLMAKERRTVQINMPLYNSVKKVYIGLERGSTLLAAEPLSVPPVVYYGSSITQGGCASRPGNSYQAIIHQNLKADYLNLGFSGSALAEEVMMEYIAALSMSAFVYDYDHNAPDVEFLEKTHYGGYRAVRTAQPDVPILILSRPKCRLTPEEEERRRIIRASYDRAIAEGDRRVYYIDGTELLEPGMEDHALVDNCHPADIGFFSMAKRIGPMICRMIEGTQLPSGGE